MVLRIANKISDYLERAAEIVVTWTFGIMVFSVLGAVFTRNARISITWMEELARYMHIWFISIGFALALKKGQLAGTEILLKILSRKTAKRIIYLCKSIMLFLCIIVVVGGNEIMFHLIQTRQASPIMRVPIVLVYSGIYLGFALAAVFIVLSIIKNVYDDPDTLDITFETTRKEIEDFETHFDTKAGE